MHSENDGRDTPLKRWLAEKIRREGDMRFRAFMEWCLYHPEHGYYMRDKPAIGKEGDYYTSSSVGTIMGEMLASEFARYWQGHPSPSCLVVEWGGGTGRLAGQVLDELAARHPDVYERTAYWIVDRSPRHRSMHRALDERHAGKWRTMAPDDWLAEIRQLPAGTVLFSNELLDAFPVHRVKFDGKAFLEQYVSWDEETSGFRPAWRPLLPEDRLADWLKKAGLAGKLAEGQVAEVNLEAEDWLCQMADRLPDGLLVTIDYGDVEDVLFAPARMAGTLMCYRNHSAHDDPFVFVGEQDITAHVNFSALMRAGEAAGLSVASFETQRDFLLRAGVLERLQEHAGTDPFHPGARRNRAIRQLLVGDRMADVFKVLIQRKGG